VDGRAGIIPSKWRFLLSNVEGLFEVEPITPGLGVGAGWSGRWRGVRGGGHSTSGEWGSGNGGRGGRRGAWCAGRIVGKSNETAAT